MDDPEQQALLKCWFSPPVNQHWFSSTPDIDSQLRLQFEGLWQQANDGKLTHWMTTANGCLALIILLDQIPLNIFRGTAKSFSSEQEAVNIARHAINHKFDQQIEKERQAFLYMPLMHSENIEDQNLSVQCFENADLKNNLRFARHHRSIILRYGRFPHRNSILGRESSEAEIQYLSSDEAFNG